MPIGVILLILLAFVPIPIFAGYYILTRIQYVKGRCTIVSKGLREKRDGDGNYLYSAKVIYSFQVPPDGITYQGDRHNLLSRSLTSDKWSQQAILDSYHVGETYPCWYKPKDPTKSVLTLRVSLIDFVVGYVFFVFAILLIIGIIRLMAAK